MKKRLLFIISIYLLTTGPAFALFINGGFESGDTTGWTVTGGGSGTGAARVDIIDNTATMDYQTLDIDPYNGNYMARLGDVYGRYDRTRLSQTDTITQTDIDNGARLYVDWGAVLVDPIYNPHGQGGAPGFRIDISIGGNLVSTFSTDATDHSNAVIAGHYGNSTGGEMWYYHTNVWEYDLSAYSMGTAVSIDFLVEDCGWGGHGGYAFLDSVGTINPGNPVPEPATMVLLGIGLLGIAGVGRKRLSS